MVLVLALLAHASAADTNSAPRNQLLAHAQKVFVTRQKNYDTEPTNNVAAWQFARAAFDRGEFATNDTERAALAVQGIAACRKILERAPKCAPASYYLGLNLGQLARVLRAELSVKVESFTKIQGQPLRISELEARIKAELG